MDDFEQKRVLVLGASGLVGRAICRRLLRRRPNQLIVTALRKREIDELLGDLEDLADQTNTDIATEWGDLFVRSDMKDRSRRDILSDDADRRTFLDDLYGHLDREVLTSSFLFELFDRYEPDVVVDCINTATALAYQNVYRSVSSLRSDIEAVEAGEDGERLDDVLDGAERLMASQYVPQLIRHVQILRRSMQNADTELYLKVGTTGTGGMGLNIPFTHSEEKPSRLLLSKSSVAGAHTMLLFLLGRTLDAPVVKEVKPAAAIGWKDIDYGEIRRHGQVVDLYDCTPDSALDLSDGFEAGSEENWQRVPGKTLESVYIDAGENGYLSLGEFAVLSNEGLMEFVTPEEIADRAITELEAGNTGKDVIAALDSSVLDPSYRAGMLRERAISKMQHLEGNHDTQSIAFELLGPPRLAKLLFEAHLLDRTTDSVIGLPDKDPDDVSAAMEAFIHENDRLRQEIVSTGTGILLSDGKRLLLGPELNNPEPPVRQGATPSSDKIDDWAEEGWVDLRPVNIERWQARLSELLEWREESHSPRFSSANALRETYWLGDDTRSLGRLVSWILEHEERGSRLK